jgi:hypothetical protein
MAFSERTNALAVSLSVTTLSLPPTVPQIEHLNSRHDSAFERSSDRFGDNPDGIDIHLARLNAPLLMDLAEEDEFIT